MPAGHVFANCKDVQRARLRKLQHKDVANIELLLLPLLLLLLLRLKRQRREFYVDGFREPELQRKKERSDLKFSPSQDYNK